MDEKNYNMIHSNEIPKHPETSFEKLKRKCKNEPIIPLGCLATATVLVAGLRSFYRGGDPKVQQRFMGARLLFQGITVGAIAIGSYIEMKK